MSTPERSRSIILYPVKLFPTRHCCELMSGSFFFNYECLAFSSGLNAVSGSHAVWMIGDPAKLRLNFKWKRPESPGHKHRSFVPWQLTSPRLCFSIVSVIYRMYIGHSEYHFLVNKNPRKESKNIVYFIVEESIFFVYVYILKYIFIFFLFFKQTC